MSVDEAAAQAPLAVLVERWHRYGRDRAYVKVSGTDVGYRDLLTGEVHCARSENVEVVTQATVHLVKLRAQRSATYQPRHLRAEESAPASSPLEPDRDLSLTVPGAAARAQASSARAAAPPRSLLDRVRGTKSPDRSWRVGADGEVEVARLLAKLGPAWRVLHAVPVGNRGSDIDHVAIGPSGVFTINTKHHPDANVWVRGDTVKVNGYNQPYVRSSRHEAQRASELLSARALIPVDVHGLIAVLGAGGLTIVEQPADGRVAVLSRKELAKYLASLPTVADPEMVDRIHSVARHLATWQPATVAWSDF